MSIKSAFESSSQYLHNMSPVSGGPSLKGGCQSPSPPSLPSPVPKPFVSSRIRSKVVVVDPLGATIATMPSESPPQDAFFNCALSGPQPVDVSFATENYEVILPLGTISKPESEVSQPNLGEQPFFDNKKILKMWR